ncbi:hypothetical protein LCGC14_3067280 [marine sediment metagenome]|uniref:Glycosyltransferase 2-like domain-containing protein n=1 Tax=marine sediment metagenome TaxID=412755 RepID=A0A0F8YPU4_9ZZZZ
MTTSDWPRMAVCLLTYERTEYAVRTVRSVCTNLKYPNLAWYVADDGSKGEHVFAVHEELAKYGVKVFGSHSEKLGPGPSWNKAIEQSLEQCDLVLWLEDDWELGEELDVTRYVRLLLDVPEVGMVRLGYMAVGLDLHSVGHDGVHYLRVEKSQPYAYSGNPSIRHRRYFDAYDWYPKKAKTNPGDCEIWHDAKFRKKDGPQIWWPMDLPLGGWGGGFGHIGQEPSYEVTP